MPTKKKFVHVDPITEEAKFYFQSYMYGLHSCIVKEEREGKLFLTSINEKFRFWMDKSGDQNWRILK